MRAVETETNQTIRSRDGLRLFFRHWQVDSPKSSLLILHGYAEHSGRYDHAAKFFNDLGIDVYAPDARGHGRSEGLRGHVIRFEQYLNDVDSILNAMEKTGTPAKRFILGHSHGGLIALAHALHRRPDCTGLVISSPFLGVAAKVPPIKLAMGRFMSIVYPSLTLPSGIPTEYLSHDPRVVTAYANDPLVFKTATVRWFTEAMGAIEELFRRAGEIKIPALFIQAGEDRVADPAKPKMLFDRLGSKDKSFIQYPGFYHEIMNETQRDRVFEDIRQWLAKRI